MSFVIFAHARSGSTSIERFLSGAVKVLPEPFHPRAADWNQVSYRPASMHQLSDTVQEIFTRFDGLRTLNFHLPDEMNRYLLSFPTVFVRRRNAKEAALSLLIAQQTNIWESWEHSDIDERYAQLKGIQKDAILKTAREITARMDAFRKILNKHFLFYYEDLHNENKVYELCNFLGVDVSQCNWDALLPAYKLNTLERYQRIPNWKEIRDVIR